MYNPLPSCLEIKKSDIHGHGLFAARHLDRVAYIGITHYCSDWNLRFNSEHVLRSPLGAFYNHSNVANVFAVWKWPRNQHGLHERIMFTLRPIRAGEELVASYAFYDPSHNTQLVNESTQSAIIDHAKHTAQSNQSVKQSMCPFSGLEATKLWLKTYHEERAKIQSILMLNNNGSQK